MRSRRRDVATPGSGTVREDVRDVDRNLNQMARGNATDQDVNVIVRSVQDVRSSAHGNTAAAFDGLLEGFARCD